MSRIILDSMVRVPIDRLSIRQLRKIRTGLKLELPSHNGRRTTTRYAYKEEGGFIALPRQSPQARQLLDRNQYKDRRSEGTPIAVQFHSDQGWRRGQLEFKDELIEELVDDELGGIGKAGCGFGKTVLACAILAELRMTTLVLAHTETIRDQWLKATQKFLGVEAGIIQGDKCQFQGYPIAVAMIHSLRQLERYPRELRRWPGLIIADECHHMSAKTFWDVITRFPAKYYLGLTATPRRADKLEDIFFWTIGDVLAEGKGDELPCAVRQIIYEPDISWEDLKPDCGKCKACKNGELCTKPKDPAFWKLLELLAEDEERTRLICNLAVKAARADRKILLLMNRLTHIGRVQEQLERIFARRNEPYTVGHFKSGKTKKIRAEKARAAQSTICIGTDRMVKEGFDVDTLDTLILAAPMKDAEQACGRIRRLLKGRKEPLILDIQDDHPFLHRSNNERLVYYREEGWKIRALRYNYDTGKIERLRRKRRR